MEEAECGCYEKRAGTYVEEDSGEGSFEGRVVG